MVEVTGNLTITAFDGPLASQLRSLRKIGSYLNIDNNPGLVSLDGLECLEDTGGIAFSNNTATSILSALSGVKTAKSIYVAFDEGIQDLSPLSGIADLEELHILGGQKLVKLPSPSGTLLRSLDISLCPNLEDLDDLTGVQAAPVIEQVTIADNASLTSIAGLASLWSDETIVMELQISALPNLNSLAGLHTLRDVNALTLRGLPTLTSLEGLEGLEDATTLYIDRLPNLLSFAGAVALKRVYSAQFGNCTEDSGIDKIVDLSGLEAVQEITTLTLAGNDSLTTFDGLNALTQGPLELFSIDNPNLSSETINAFISEHGVASSCQAPPQMCECVVHDA